jgi:hypothetical protein
MELFHRFALKNGLPLLEYCTLPRTGALEIIMQVLGPESDGFDSQKMSRTVSNLQSQGLKLNEKNNESIATNSCSAKTEDLKQLNDDIPDTREVVTNNNQIKWNTERYFR